MVINKVNSNRMSSKTVTSKFTEVIVEGKKYHIKFSDSDMKFEVIEFERLKKWYSKRPIEVPKTIYTGTSETYQQLTKNMMYSINAALVAQREQINNEILGVGALRALLEKIEEIGNSKITQNK